MKPVNLNQLLFHKQTDGTLSFFQSPNTKLEDTDAFLQDMQTQLDLRGKSSISKLLDKSKPTIKKLLKSNPDKSYGFFISDTIQGYVGLETYVDNYCMIGNTFHVRPLLEELFVNPEFLVVNVSLYDINVYRGDFHHLEIIQHYEFESLAIDMKSRVFNPVKAGLIPYKSILALKTIAQNVQDLTHYDSIPVLVTGLEDMKVLFLRNMHQSQNIISHIHEDFYEKTCVQILEKCKQFRYSVVDFYSSRFKDRLKKMVKSKRLISDLPAIIEATRNKKVIHLVLPTERKIFGKINIETGEYEIHKRVQKKTLSVDILNELAEEVIRQGGKIQILAPHFFPQDAFVLAILRG